MKIKICGLKYIDNIAEIVALKPDFVGFIFYEKSKRFVGVENASIDLNFKSTSKVAVFVNEKNEIIENIAKRHHFKYVQLHGNETPLDCKYLNDNGLLVIKAFGIDNQFNFSILNDYKPFVKYFLFDTKTSNFGGSGKSFDWLFLKDYVLDIPFFLSGGIGLDDFGLVKEINHPALFAIDVNSKMEIEPGLKDKVKCSELIDKIKSF